MMKARQLLFLCSVLPVAAQQMTDLTKVPRLVMEGWGVFSLPMPDGYTIRGSSAEDHYTFRVVPAASAEGRSEGRPYMEIYSGLSAPELPEGEPFSTVVAGETVKGVHTEPTAAGEPGVSTLLMKKGVEGAYLCITVPDGDYRDFMFTLLERLQIQEPEKTEEEKPDMSAAVPQSFRIWGTVTLPVPPAVQVVPQDSAEFHLLHVYGADKKEAMTIYSGFEPDAETGGKPCAAVIAGEQVRGQKLAGKQEYLLERGTQGAVLHIVVYDGPERQRMLAMLAGMVLQAPATLPDEAKARARAVFGTTNDLTAAVNALFANVKDEKTAVAAVPRMRELLAALQTQETEMEQLSKRYGRAVPAFVSTLAPSSVTENSRDANIQRVHDAECYGCAELQELLEDFMGL